jgi:hypothetical protein
MTGQEREARKAAFQRIEAANHSRRMKGPSCDSFFAGWEACGEYRAALTVREPQPDTERPDERHEKALQAALDAAKKVIAMGERPGPGSGEVEDEELLAEQEAWDDKYAVYELLLQQLDRVVRGTEQEHEPTDGELTELIEMPRDLARVLKDPDIIIAQDAAVFELIAKWQNAPKPTIDVPVYEPSGDERPAGFGMCGDCGNPLTDREMMLGDTCDACRSREAQADDLDEHLRAQGARGYEQEHGRLTEGDSR